MEQRREPDAAESTLRPFKRGARRGGERTPLLTSPEASARMGRVGRRDTAPELAVRRIARGMGLRFTTKNRDLAGSPDLANRSKRMVVFVHGCFWHRHAGCPRATTPKRNRGFWVEKFERNVERDLRACESLKELGFRVAVVWECEVRDSEMVASKLRALRTPASPVLGEGLSPRRRRSSARLA